MNLKSALVTTALLIGGVGSASAQQVYVGAFTGANLTDTTVNVGGVKLIDQGGDAFLAGIRVGIQTPNRSGWFAGVEAEAATYEGRSRAVVNGDVFNYAIQQSYGVYGRFGASNGRGSVYFRPGYVYLNTSMGNQGVPSLGGGIEVRWTNDIAFRLDAAYTWYNPGWALDKVENYQITFGVSYYF